MQFEYLGMALLSISSVITVGFGAELTQVRTTGLRHLDFRPRTASGLAGRNDSDIIFTNFVFESFNINLGLLTSVKASFFMRFHPKFEGSSPPPRVAAVHARMTATHTLTPPGTVSPLRQSPLFEVTRDFSDIPPITTVVHDYGAAEGDTGLIELPTNVLNRYCQGLGQIEVPLAIECATGVFMSNGTINYRFSTDYEASASLRYEYVPFMITSMTTTKFGEVSITWNSKPGLTYQLQWTSSLGTSGWIAVTNVVAQDGNARAVVAISNSNQHNFYRIVVP